MARSRLCKKPIVFNPAEVSYSEPTLLVKGKHGELSLDINPSVSVEFDDAGSSFSLLPKDEGDRFSVAISGTMTAIVKNMVKGVTESHTKTLELHGVGYRAKISGNNLTLSLGYSHDVIMSIPKGLQVTTPSQTEIVIAGADKQAVGQFAANIKSKRPVEPYKGKGIRYKGQFVLRKEGKKK